MGLVHCRVRWGGGLELWDHMLHHQDVDVEGLLFFFVHNGDNLAQIFFDYMLLIEHLLLVVKGRFEDTKIIAILMEGCAKEQSQSQRLYSVVLALVMREEIWHVVKCNALLEVLLVKLLELLGVIKCCKGGGEWGV